MGKKQHICKKIEQSAERQTLLGDFTPNHYLSTVLAGLGNSNKSAGPLSVIFVVRTHEGGKKQFHVYETTEKAATLVKGGLSAAQLAQWREKNATPENVGRSLLPAKKKSSEEEQKSLTITDAAVKLMRDNEISAAEIILYLDIKRKDTTRITKLDVQNYLNQK